MTDMIRMSIFVIYEYIRFMICNYARLVLADPVENEEVSVYKYCEGTLSSEKIRS